MYLSTNLILVIVVFSLFGLILTACDETTPRKTTAQNAVPPATQPASLSAKMIPDANGKIHLSDDEWKQLLTADQYYILRQKGTERPFQNAYFDHHEQGVYVCAACGQELFGSQHKFDSGCGWPSYWQAISPGRVEVSKDADGVRDELTCSRCGGHLGHVFDDGPKPTGQRYCIDSGALKFKSGK